MKFSRLRSLVLFLLSLVIFVACGSTESASCNTDTGVTAVEESTESEESTRAEESAQARGPADERPAQAPEADTGETRGEDLQETSDATAATDLQESSDDTAATDLPETSNDTAATDLQESSDQVASIDRDGTYTSKEDVSLYLHTYGELPENFITKKEAKALGWEGGSVEKYAPGKCIGGDYFGNYEGLLPEEDGREFRECDIDTLGKSSRGAKRIIYSNDGLIYYTDDHYESFTLLYGEE